MLRNKYNGVTELHKQQDARVLINFERALRPSGIPD